MNGGIRQSMAWLHTWTGLLFGWILFGMFCTGTATYFRPEITRWMEPETGKPAAAAVAAAGAQSFLDRKIPNAKSWNIALPDEREATTKVSWQPVPKKGEKKPRGRGRLNRDNQATLDAATGEVVKPRDTRGGEFFYRVHFQLHYMSVPTGRWIVGLAAMFMLTAIVSGVITHKRIFQDFFTFRPKKAAQRSWLDAHNMTAVLALPFHVMITYTGLITLMSMYMPWGVKANYEKPETFFEQLFPRNEPGERNGVPASVAPLPIVIAKAQQTWGEGSRVGNVSVQNPGDSSAKIIVTRHSGDQLAYQGGSLTFDGVTGELLTPSPAKGPATITTQAMYGLHMGRFSQPVARWLYFLGGLSGCAMVATGLVLWTVKRRKDLPNPEKPHFGFRLVERLNIGAIAGVPAGMAAMLWANRLLPVEMAKRSPWEVNTFFILWGVMILYACLRPPKRAWVETLGAAAFLVAAVPVVSAVTTPHRSLMNNIINGDWALVAFDLTLPVLAAILAFTAYKAHAYKPLEKKSRREPAPKKADAAQVDAAKAEVVA